MKFRKKPITIDAFRTDRAMVIPTLEGDMTALPGDWIITGVNGEQYPCKPNIFEVTYDCIGYTGGVIPWEHVFSSLEYSQMMDEHWSM